MMVDEDEDPPPNHAAAAPSANTPEVCYYCGDECDTPEFCAIKKKLEKKDLVTYMKNCEEVRRILNDFKVLLDKILRGTKGVPGKYGHISCLNCRYQLTNPECEYCKVVLSGKISCASCGYLTHTDCAYCTTCLDDRDMHKPHPDIRICLTGHCKKYRMYGIPVFPKGGVDNNQICEACIMCTCERRCGNNHVIHNRDCAFSKGHDEVCCDVNPCFANPILIERSELVMELVRKRVDEQAKASFLPEIIPGQGGKKGGKGKKGKKS